MGTPTDEQQKRLMLRRKVTMMGGARPEDREWVNKSMETHDLYEKLQIIGCQALVETPSKTVSLGAAGWGLGASASTIPNPNPNASISVNASLTAIAERHSQVTEKSDPSHNFGPDIDEAEKAMQKERNLAAAHAITAAASSPALPWLAAMGMPLPTLPELVSGYMQEPNPSLHHGRIRAPRRGFSWIKAPSGPPTDTVIVSGLPSNVTDVELVKIFGEYGNVVKVTSACGKSREALKAAIEGLEVFVRSRQRVNAKVVADMLKPYVRQSEELRNTLVTRHGWEDDSFREGIVNVTGLHTQLCAERDAKTSATVRFEDALKAQSLVENMNNRTPKGLTEHVQVRYADTPLAKMMKHKYSMQLEALGPAHEETASTIFQLGEHLIKIGLLHDAEEPLLACLDTAEKSSGHYSMLYTTVCAFLGQLYHKLAALPQRGDETMRKQHCSNALKYYKSAMISVEHLLGWACRETVFLNTQMGFMELMMGERDKGVKRFRQALETVEQDPDALDCPATYTRMMAECVVSSLGGGKITADRHQHELDKALEDLHMVAETQRLHGLPLANTYLLVGVVQALRGSPEAPKCLEQAVDEAKHQLDMKFNDGAYTLPTGLCNLGLWKLRAGQRREADKLFAEAEQAMGRSKLSSKSELYIAIKEATWKRSDDTWVIPLVQDLRGGDGFASTGPSESSNVSRSQRPALGRVQAADLISDDSNCTIA